MMRGRWHFIRIWIAGIECPDQSSGIDVETPDHARRHPIGIVVDHRSPDDQYLIGHDRRRCPFVKAESGNLVSRLEINLSVVAEPSQGLPLCASSANMRPSLVGT